MIRTEMQTPAFIYDPSKIRKRLSLYASLTNCHKLYALKTLEFEPILEIIAETVEGFAASSLFETKLAAQVLKGSGSIHYTAPAIRDDEIEEIASLAKHINFNSLSQFHRLKNKISTDSDIGLRINPGVSLIKDERYDPCKKYSRLGIVLDEVVDFLDNGSDVSLVSGIHFHNNCDANNFKDLERTVDHIIHKLGSRLAKLKWINLGGGYIFHESKNLDLLQALVNKLHGDYGLEVFLEPGAAIVRDACTIVSSVLDIVKADGKEIVILDTTVNHIPEVFEYQWQPDLLEADKTGNYEYILTGNTCLAGDSFGTFSFKHALEIGSRVTFIDMGAYSHVKSDMFNGINLPSIYELDENQGLILKKTYGYEDFLAKNT